MQAEDLLNGDSIEVRPVESTALYDELYTY